MALHSDAVKYRQMFHRYQSNVLDKRDRRIGLYPELMPKRQKTVSFSANSMYEKPMPKPDLPPVFLQRPLNLNEDGSSITYRKSHEGPHSTYWEQPMPKKLNASSRQEPYDHFSLRAFRQASVRPTSTQCAAKNCVTQALLRSALEQQLVVIKSVILLIPRR